MHLDQLKRLVARAATGGAKRLALTRWEWDIAGSCQEPVTRELFARKDRKAPYRDNEWNPGEDVPLTLIMHMKCRACPDCRRLRRREWYLRAGIELSRCKRSWFGTLTLSPESAFRCEVFARRRLLSGGTIWEQLRPKDRYGELCRQVGSEVTLYLKRLRKQSGARLKYMACFEPHRSGIPHLHMLVHEYDDTGLRKSQLDAQWNHGFTHWRLVPSEDAGKAAAYVAKYITKEGGRVRSSLGYGKTTNVLRHSVPQGTACAEHTRPPPVFHCIGDKVTAIEDTAVW